jgi:uncharacterized protein YggE
MKTFLSALVMLAFAGFASANITVSGNGKVTYTPDIGYVTVGVSSEGETAQEAWAKNREIVEKLFAFLKAQGLDPKDMQTSGLNVSPKYHYVKDQPPRLIGYTVSYDLKVTCRKLDQMGVIVDGLVSNGANRNVNVAFGIADPEKLQDEALRKAVEAARKKAQIEATAAGAQLGSVISISDNQNLQFRQYTFEYAPAAAGADKSLPIAAGEQSMDVTVHLVFAIYPMAGK